MTPGRNEPCHCGSGEKYKHCCESKEGKRTSRTGLIVTVIGVLLVGSLVFADQLKKRRSVEKEKRLAATTATPATPQAPLKPGPQPPGPAPAGKVWAADHGHWHDTPVSAITASSSGGLQALPAGQRPAGAAQPAITQGSPSATPTTPGQAGEVWSTEHNHWHKAPATSPRITPPPASSAQGVVVPGARIPTSGTQVTGDQVWSAEHKHWHKAPAAGSNPP